MRRTKLTRSELHALVWEKPLRTAAKELGVSDVGLSKICKRHGVPTPPQGHWTRVQMGKPVTKGELPLAAPGQAETIEIVAWSSPAIADAAATAPCPPGEQSRRETLLAREAEAEFQIIVRENPKTLHPMAARVKAVLKDARTDDYGCVRCSEPALPAVRVSPAASPRAVKLVDALARAAEARRFAWKAGGGQHWDSAASLVIEEMPFPIEIYETVQRRPHQLTPEEKAEQAQGRLYWSRTYDYFGTNRFSLRRDEWRQYLKDSKHQKIEDRLNDLFSILICNAFEAREERRRRAIAEDLAARRKAWRAEIERLRNMEKTALATLQLHAENRRKAEDLRSLVAAVAAAGGDDGKRREWMAWAAAHADSIDPLCHDQRRLLDVDFEGFARLRRMESEGEPGELDDIGQ